MNKQIQASGIFCIIGILLLIIAFLIQQYSFASSLIANIAIISLTVVILNFLWNLLGGEPVANSLQQLTGSLQRSFQGVDDKLEQSFQIVRDCHSVGLAEVSSDAQQKHINLIERLRNAEISIDLMGYTLIDWVRTPEFSAEILKLIQRNVKIRVLIMDHTNSHFECFINEGLGGYTIDGALHDIKAAKAEFDSLQRKIQATNPTNTLGSLDLRTVKEGLIACSICRTDTQMTVLNYLYWRQVPNSPFMLLQKNNDKNSLFQVYQSEFDKFWDPDPLPVAP